MPNSRAAAIAVSESEADKALTDGADGESAPTDSVSRFGELHDESLKLLDAARTLVVEMRSALDDCRRHRPVIETPRSANAGQPAPPAVKTHRGGRVPKKHGRRRWRRPR
jgi:hypothetical protein